jgi:hypothetical protein
MKNQLTLLTLPVPDGPDGLRHRLWLAARQVNYWRKFQRQPRYGGHYAVTRSLVEGMAKAGLPVNYNPQRTSEVAENVHVFGVQNLRQMIRWKREGIIQQLTCGPNVVVRSSEANSILASPEIDAVVNHADWACDFWALDNPELRYRCLSWFAGVDTDFWRPVGQVLRDRILVFDKRREDQDPERIKSYIEYLKKEGWQVDVLTRCGRQGYDLENYRNLLQRAALMIGFTVGSESQGIAWTEAWASNVPTLILQQTENFYQGIRFRCSTAPVLTSATGAFFNDFDGFVEQFKLWRSGHQTFNPREWVLDNMSDEVCASDLYEKLINLPQHLLFRTQQKG